MKSAYFAMNIIESSYLTDMTKPTSDQIAEFLLSEELQELSERLKTSDGLLDLISLVENQHSSVIAWMCDSREGHGQGDAILRDLLCHASATAQHRVERSGSTKLTGATASFFRKWTPEKILTTSLSAAFISTEFADKADDRLDMLVIDPSNRLVIAIENKVNARISNEQLSRYRQFVGGLCKTGKLKGFDAAYIVIDKKFDDDDEDVYAASVGSEYRNWLVLSYDWLRHAAVRSTVQIGKGQMGGRLIQTYCRQQIGWESEDDKVCSQLAASLWLEHRAVVTSLCAMSSRPDKFWVLNDAATKTIPPELQLFAVQNRDVLRALFDAKGFVAVRRRLRKEHPALPDELIHHARAWMDVVPNCLNKLADDSAEYWPIYLSARLNHDNDSCKLRLIFDTKHLAPHYKPDDLRNWAKPLAKGVGTYSRSRFRRITIAEKVSLDALHTEFINWERKIEELHQKAPLCIPKMVSLDAD